ncbi:hypothetical protein AB1J28_03795 [Lysinibacillus irui]|uniref:hypothetical protein n=1 Tax=Lysinibacillus irui TaxID=2998077 RepID=UPI003D26AC29
MFTPTVDEASLKHTLVAYLESENHIELSKIIEHSDLNYEPQYEFSGVVSYQRKLFLIIRVPIAFKKRVEDQLSILNKYVFDIYRDDNDYMLTNIKIGIRAIQLENFNVQDNSIIVEKESVYSTLIKRLVADNKLTDLHKKYLFEACSVGSSGNMMAATMMLGCAAEIALIKLVEATFEFYKKNKSDVEISNFEKKVMGAKTAFIRLDELSKRLKIEKAILMSFGVENVDVFFSIFEIIRLTRNDVGHPTGNILSKEKFEVQLSAYMTVLNQYQQLLEGLPTVKVEINN